MTTRAQQSTEVSVEDAEAEAIKWYGIFQQRKRQEMEARDAESQAEQAKQLQLKEQAHAQAVQEQKSQMLQAAAIKA